MSPFLPNLEVCTQSVCPYALTQLLELFIVLLFLRFQSRTCAGRGLSDSVAFQTEGRTSIRSLAQTAKQCKTFKTPKRKTWHPIFVRKQTRALPANAAPVKQPRNRQQIYVPRYSGLADLRRSASWTESEGETSWNDTRFRRFPQFFQV